MDKFPDEILNNPTPLAYLLGSLQSQKEPDIDLRIISCLTELCDELPVTGSTPYPALKFRRVNFDQVYYSKAPAKDVKDVRNTDGILKASWLIKHTKHLPSVVVLISPFNIGWTSSEWVKHEASLFEQYQRLKANLYTRDVKIVMVVVKQQGVATNSMDANDANSKLPVGTAISQDKDVLEERLSSMRRRFQIDSKYFLFMSPLDFSPNSLVCKKLAKLIRECSTSYYITNSKRLKVIAKSITNKQAHSILIARFYFKVAFYFEFLNQQMSHSLKYYKTCFEALSHIVEATLHISANSMSSIQVQSQHEFMGQVKVLASWVNYKICKILFRAATGNLYIPPANNYANMFSPVNTAISTNNNTPIKDGTPLPPNVLNAAPNNTPNPAPAAPKVSYITEACKQFRSLMTIFGAGNNIINVYGANGGVGNYLVSSTRTTDGSSDDKYSSTAMMIHQQEYEASSGYPVLYRHYGWMVDQYLTFVKFLEQYNILPNVDVDTDRVNYCYNAYKYTKLRYLNYQLCLEKEVISQKADNLEFLQKYQNYIVLSPKYVGEAISLVEPSSPLVLSNTNSQSQGINALDVRNGINVRKLYILALESKIPHLTLQQTYLGAAMSYVPSTRHRHLAVLSSFYADLCMHKQQMDDSAGVITVPNGYESALKMYLTVLESYSSEDWLHVAIPVLEKAFQCAKHLGNLSECFQLGLKLFAFSKKLMEGVEGL